MYRVRPLTGEMTLHITVSHPAETSISVHTMQLYNCYQAYRNNQNSRFCLEHFGQIGSAQQAAQFLYIFAWFLCIAHQTRRNLHLNAKPAPQKLDSLVSSANPDRFCTALDTKKAREPYGSRAGLLMVGVTRFELVTSSVSGKRSPPELNARSGCAFQRR